MVFSALWTRIKQALSRTSSLFTPIAQLFRLRGRVDRQFLEELEKRLYLADVGTGATAQIVDGVRQAYLDNDPPCLEYEYVAGGDLVGLVHDGRRQGGLPAGTVLQVMQRLAEAVAFAHRFEPPIVHRDLKPANILVQRGTGGVRLKVADFGIGGLAASHALAESARTATGRGPWLTSAVRGACTPLYASPEQEAGQPPGEKSQPLQEI